MPLLPPARLALSFVIAATAVLHPTIALGDEPSSNRFDDRRVALEGHIAPTGSQVGLLGATAHYAIVPSLSLGAGVGSSPYGAQVAGSARVLLALENAWALVYETGVSRGRYQDFEIWHEGDVPAWDVAYWGNVSAGLEHRGRNGFVVRPYLGCSVLFNARGRSVLRPCSWTSVNSVQRTGLRRLRFNPSGGYWLNDEGRRIQKPFERRPQTLPVVGVALGAAF